MRRCDNAADGSILADVTPRFFGLKDAGRGAMAAAGPVHPGSDRLPAIRFSRLRRFPARGVGPGRPRAGGPTRHSLTALLLRWQ